MKHQKSNQINRLNVNDYGLRRNFVARSVIDFGELGEFSDGHLLANYGHEVAILDPKAMEQNIEFGFGQVQYSYHYKAKTLKPDHDCQLVALIKPVSVPNERPRDKKNRFVGIYHEKGIKCQLWFVKNEMVTSKGAYAISLSLRLPQEHMGAIRYMTTRGVQLFLVVQDRSKLKRSDVNNLYALTTDFEKIRQYQKKYEMYLVKKGLLFQAKNFDIEEEEGFGDKVNLVKRTVEGTVDTFLETNGLTYKEIKREE